MSRTWPALDLQRGDPETTELVEALLVDFGILAIDDNAPDAWRVFFHEPGDRDRAASAVSECFPGVFVNLVDVPDQDWAVRSQAALRAVRIGKIIVAPPWDTPATRSEAENPDSLVIVIQPSMGFGTGHHATTRLCLSALQELAVRGRRVIDVGTGSGVLAIAASLLGAESALGIDDDADAIAAARENAQLNPASRATFDVADFRSWAGSPFDVVVANLTGGLLVAASSKLLGLASATGQLVISGFMDVEEADVRRAFSTLTVSSRSQEDEWVAMTLTVGP